LLSWWRNDPRFVSRHHSVTRTEDDDYAWKQSALFTCNCPSRADPRSSPSGVYGCALQALQKCFQYAVFDRRLGSLLGAVVVGSRISEDTGRQNRFPLLASSSLRANRLFLELSHGKDDTSGVH